MNPYLRPPLLRVIIVFGVVFLAGSLLGVDAQSTPSPTPEKQNEPRTLFKNLVYLDTANHRTWFFDSLDIASGKGQGVQIVFRDADGHLIKKYSAHEGTWNGTNWKLTDVTEVTRGPGAKMEKHDVVDLPDVTTPPSTLTQYQ